MKRIDTSTRAIDLFGPGKDGFKNGDLANNIAPTDFNADWPNQVQEEIANVIEGAGIVLSGASRTQLLQAIGVLARGRLLNFRVITSSGTYTPTAGTNSIEVLGVAGGGAGGGSGTTTAGQVSVGAGGGGGGWFRKRLATGFAGLSMVVGAGGAGAAASAGGAGGTTSFGTYSASGGSGGPFGTQSANSSTFPMGQASPGIGNVSADVSGAGMAGQYGIVAPSGQISGQGGASIMGGGANWVFTNGAGLAASSPGSGGSGACAGQSYGINQAGGNGGGGIILIWEYA